MSNDAAVVLARQFHDAYEKLAPSFGYTTRPDTRQFDPESPNGQLMTAVVRQVIYAENNRPRFTDKERGVIEDLIRYCDVSSRVWISESEAETQEAMSIWLDRCDTLRGLLEKHNK